MKKNVNAKGSGLLNNFETVGVESRVYLTGCNANQGPIGHTEVHTLHSRRSQSVNNMMI